MQVIDIDAASFRDWLAQTEIAGSARSAAHCPMALFLDEIEGGEHVVSRDIRGRYTAILDRRCSPSPRLDPGEERPLPEWAQRFINKVDTIDEGVLEPSPIPGVFAVGILDRALEEEQ